MTTATITVMATVRAQMADESPTADTAGLVRLATMLSPYFPVGGFAYSAGLERAAFDDAVRDADTLRDWLAASLGHGAARNDAILFADAFRRGAAGSAVGDLHDLALAMAGSSERHAEAAGQGASFAEAVRANGGESGERAYAVAAGGAAGETGVALETALALFLAAWAAHQVQVAIRLSIVGQSGGVAALAALEPLIEAMARRAAASTLDDLGGCAVLAEIASMNHEIMQTRLFRS